MAQQDDNIKKLYDELQSTYDVGSEDDFRNYLNNAEHRKALYNELKNDYDIQDEKAFDDYLGYINGEKALGTTKVGSVAQQVVNEYDQSAKDNAEAEEDLSAATSGAKIGGNISFAPAKPNNQQTVQPDVDNTAKSVMDASGTPAEQAKATGPKTQFVPEDPNYVQATPTAEALKKYPWMQPDQVYMWNRTTKEPVVTYVDESGHAVIDEDLQIKKAKSEITGQDDTEYMYPEAAALQLPNGNTTGLKIKKGALTQMADEILRKEYGDNYLNTQFGKDGNVYTGAERRDLGAQQLYDELNSDVRNARISFAVADEKDRNEILSRIKAKWGKVADANSIINAVNDENAAKRDIDIVAQQNINELNAEIQKISQQMDLRGAEIDNASSPFVDQTFNARDVDPKYRILQSKLNYAQNALKSWENVKNSSSLNAFSGFKDAIMDISAWDFGFSDLKNSIALLTAKGNDKQELVNLYGKSSEATKFEDKYNPDSYRYGKIAGASIPFALQFVGTGGGFKSIGSAVSKKATSIAEKYALEGLKKQVVKGLGVVAGDIARAYTMSGTIQGLNTISDILNRSAGELTVDKQGNYQLKSDEPLLKSIYKGVTASAIENYTEMLGERLNIGGNLMRMLPKIGLGRVSNAITKIGTQDWYRVCNNWLSRAGVNDFGGEVLEEEIGIILNAALVGDNPLFNGSGGLLDVRTQKDILGGMLYSISAMRAGALAMYGVKKGVGSAFIKTLDMYDKMQLNQSDKGGQSIFGEGWAAIKDEIDNTPNEKVNAVIEKLAKEHPSKDEQSAIIDYAVKLLKTRGHNLGIAMASDGENDEGAQEEVQDMPDLSQPNAEYFNKDDGMIHKASLYPDASDPTGTAKDVFIIKGNLVTNEDGSINKDASDDTIIYIDGNGERHIASPDKFAAAYPPMSNDEVQQANEGVTGEGTQTTDTFNKGDEVNINVNGIIYTATIQGTDGSGNYNVYYEDENGMMRPAQFTADQLASMNSASTASNDKQNMIEQLAGNQQQIEQSAEEQVAQQEQPAQEEQKPAIPTDEKGNMLYHQVPVETTINDLYDGSLDDNEIRDFVDANISEADKNLEKVNKKAPKIGTNKDEYLKKKQEWQKQVEDATRIRDYWNSVKNYIAQQTHTTPEEIKVAQDELSGEAARREYQDMGGSVQQDAVSVASDFIRGAKITPESFKAETGYGTDEQRKFVGMIAKAENGGKTIDRLAEELVSYDNAEMNGVLFGGDTSSAKDAILSALQGAGTRGELKQTNEAEEQAYIDARNAARDEQYMEQYGMTYEEYLVYEEQIMPTIWREYNNYDEVAFNNMYAEEIEQLIKSIENDTTGEEQADDRGNQVLPEQQVTEQRGSTGSQEQRTEAPVGVQGNNENAVAPEEASGERIPNIERGRQGYTGYIARRQQNNLETSEEINVPLSQNEQDEYGNPMVLAENGSTVFGTIESESGLTEAPIKLSLGENKVGTDGKNHGYGLLHIEAGHGEQIRNAGYQSVEQFVENVAQNYTDIKEGALIGKKQTYLLEVSDEHNNTLFIQLSNDGTYWNVNSAGIFKKKYSRRKPLIYTVPAVGKSTVTDTSEVNSGQSMGATAPAGNSSESKDSDKSAFAQTIDEKIAKAEEETDVNPTEGQKEAGNYKKGHVCIDGYDITIEQPKGSVRRGTDADGKQWEQTMNNTYGYIRGTEGVDGDHIDIFLSDNPTEGNVYVVDQVNPDGSFDEHKVMYGFNSAEDARAAYLSNYEEGWQGLSTITEVSKDEFKKWLNSSRRKTKPFSEYKSVNAIGAQNEDNTSQIQGLQGYSRDKIKNIVKDYVGQKLSDADAKIKGVEIHGSRNRGDAREDSDLDVVIEYEGDIREDDMFNLLNDDEDALYIEDIRVDINPIREQETGTLDKYMDRSREYDEEKKNKEYLESISNKEKRAIAEGRTEYYIPVYDGWGGQRDGRFDKVWLLPEDVDKYGSDLTYRNLDLWSKEDAYHTEEGFSGVRKFFYNKEELNKAYFGKSKTEEKSEKPASQTDYEKIERDNFNKTYKKINDSIQGNIPNIPNIKKRIQELKKSIPILEKSMATSVSNDKEFDDAQRRIYALTGELKAWQKALKEINDKLKKSGETTLSDKAEAVEEKPVEEKKPEYGANNKVVSKERYEELKKRMIKKLGQLNFGMDPELIEIGVEMTAYHLEAGARKFADYAKAMINDVGDVIRPYLKSLYNAARDYPDVVEAGLNVGMSTGDEVSKFDVTNFDKKTIDALATADNVVKEQNIKKETEKIIKENEKKSEQTAKKSVSSQKIADLFGDINGSTKSDAQRRFSDTVKSDMLSALDRGEKPYRSIVDLRKRASEVGMDVDNEGRSDILLQELVEDGLVGAAREVVNKYGSDSKDSYDLICKLYDMQPTIAARSSNRIKMQQYSTPLPMAWNAAHFAMSGKHGGKVLEPTAGNGMLVFAVPANQVHANELDETRLNNLREQGFAEVTQQDATEPFEGGKQYDSIIANPPFGSREAVDYGGKMIPGLDPQITLNALSSMKDDGKAAIIIGGNMEYAKNGSIKSMKPFFTYLYDHYNVKGVVDMDGKLYAKQGTTFPTRMILIDGRRSEEERAQTTVYPPVESKAVAKVSSFEELYNTVNDIINSKEKTNGTEILHSREREPLSVNNRPSGDTEGNRRTEQPRKNDARGRGNKSEGSKNKSERVLPGEHRKNIGNGGVRSEATGSEPGRSRGNNEPDIQRVDGVGVSTDRVGLKEEPKKRTLTEEKLPYRPHNTAFSLNSVAPSAMVEAMDKILTQIEKENGNIDEFVRKELGYDTIEEAHQALAAEQMDSVAMAIYQMKKGQALIIGDQTGVGKGRQMAALIRWAVKRGEKPIFITQKADLFSDIYRDLVDVGSGDLVPFIFNSDGAMVDSNGNVVHKPLSASAMSKVFASGELPDSYDFAVLTYTQVDTGDAISKKEAEEAAKKSGTRAKKSKASKEGKPTPKATFLRAIAKDNYLFLDESHTAAGSGNTGAYLQSILKSAKAATFASATFAKRPDTMPLYAIRTAMSQAKIEPEKLISIIEKGGVTLQEIMSRELTNAGQMVRRERDMSDVKTDWKTIDDPSTVKRARENYDKTIQAFNAIIKFQNDFVKPKTDDLDQSLAIVAQSAGIKKGTDKMGVENVPFASKTYNYTKQLMLALKVDAIADEVEKEINAGRHPVIALESTMESTIKDYSAGEVIKEPTFSASLLKGLDSVMQYTIKDEDGKETHARYAPSDLGKAGEEAYYNLQKLIRESTSDIFISPLDAIIERLHEKGYKVGELTGRNLYVERNENGEVVVKRRTDKDKKKMQRDFNSGNLDVLILNKSASTGISLHASEKFKDQRQRTMIIAQPLSDINDYMQMIGRIDRTGQVHRGYYINLGLPVPAENRFLMMLSTKLKSLNANTTTSQDSKSNEVEAPDLLNKYGSQVVVEYLRDNPEVYEKMGAPPKKGGLGSGKVQASELDKYKPQDDDARKITGYVALLSTKEQEDFYNDVVKRYNDLIQYLNDTGSNDLKINVMPLRAKTLEKRVSSEGIDPNGTNPFAKNAYVEKVEMDVLRKPMKAEEVRKTIDKLNKTSVDVTTDVIRKESDAKIASENARYENAREKALDDIQKQKEKIEKSKKLSDEEKVAAINSYITDTNNTIEERHDKNLKKITDNRDQLVRRLRMFDAGKSYLVPDNLESMTFDFASPAIFCGYKAKENKITASTTLAVFATLDSRRRIEIKLSDINALQSIDKMTMDNIDAARAITIDNWDSQIPTETRKEGYILTGNILQAIADSQDEYGGYTGHLVSYTDIDGNIHDGILMPDKWNTSLLKSSGAPLSARMEQIKRYEPIVSSDGKVTLNGSQWAEMYYLTVPKTKKDGAMYYENKVLLDASKGEFYPYRGNLRADIPAENIEGVVKELTKLGVKVRESNDVVSEGANTNEGTNDLYRFIGETGARNLDAAEEATTRLDNLSVAREMENAGKDAKTIKIATGWERGADSKWRYEVPDGKSVFQINPNDVNIEEERKQIKYRLSKINSEINSARKSRDFAKVDSLVDEDEKLRSELANLKVLDFVSSAMPLGTESVTLSLRNLLDDTTYNDLVNAYDEISRIKVKLISSSDLAPLQGSYDDKRSELDLFVNNTNNLHSTLMHEIQHIIQGIEGFAQGGNGTEIQQAIDQIESKISDILKSDAYKKAINDFGKEYEQKIDKEVENNYSDLEPERKQAVRMAMRDDALIEYKKKSPVLQRLSNLESELNVLRYNPSYKSSYVYNNLSGEVEARNVEARINMIPEERRQSLASETEDVAREDQLFIYDNLGANARQGAGALTDSELSNANDPAGKMLGKPSRTPAQQKAFAERERQRMADRAREVADILHLDNVEIVTDASTLKGRRAKAKGFYSRDNGKIVIVVPNHVDMADIEQTVLHEAVAHYGLRKLFGSNFDTFLYNVYNNADMDVREKISQLAAQHNWNFATATEEYLASLAEKTNFENLNASWWDKIKSLFLKLLHSIGLKGFTGVSLSDNELRYILWRSYENLKNPGRYRSIIDEAKDITMQNELRVGNYSAGNSEAVGKAAENGVVNIEDVNRRFNEELGRLTEENAQSVILNLGRPGNFLLASGLSDRPIKLYGNKLLKKMRKHGFTTSDVKNLPKEINNPIAVFKGSVENSFAILTELEINGNNVLASISVGKGNDIDFNIISSVYGKNGNSVVSWINDGKILYVNKEKALNYLRISAPIAEAQDNQELSSAANIVKNFENPNISEENMRYGNGALAASESNGINKTNETNGQEAEEANRRFNEELNAFKAKTHKGLLHLGQPGRILNACGINEELTLSPTVLSRKLKQHGLNVDDIKGLAGAIQEPILVYQHGDAHPNMVIVTDLAAKGGKVSVAVELDGEGNVVELNNVSSVHSKGATTELERLSNMRDGYLEQALRWVDKNKVSDWLGIADLNSPIHANNPKLVSIANILQNFENPSVGEENILYREAKKVEKKINSDWRDEYDKKLSKFSFKLTEAAQDAMRSVKILQDIIAKETSAPIRDDENVYWRENRLSSVNKYEQEYYNENYCKPIVTEIANLVKYGARYNDKGEDIINSDNDVLKYLIAKSGLERNQSKREVEAMNARKPYEDQIKELQKQVEKEEIKEENANKKIAKLQEQADKAEMNKRVAVLHKDYSGLTELFQDEKDFDTLATSYVSDFEKKFDTESLWNAINRATKETLRKAFVDGLISRESYESTAKMYKYYIPLRGWANDVASEAYNYKGSGEGSRKILQTAKGRTSLADNPISEIGRMMQDAIFQGNRNRMKQAVYNLAMNHDTSLLNIKRQWYQNMGTEEDPAWERVFPDLNSDMTAEQVAEEVEEFESRMRELKKEGRATQSRKGLILRLHTTKREEAQHRISVAINGKEYNIFVNGNPRAAQAINGELNDVDRYGSAVAKVNRFLSQVYTSINPEFVVTNYQRDAGFAASIVASTEPWSYQKEWAKNMTVYNPITTGVYLNRLIKKAKTGNINPSNKAERYMQEFLSHGGETGFTNMLSADDYKKQIKRDIKSINSVVSLSKASRAAVAFTERANTVFEDATRYATYVTSREQGRTIDRSIRDAKEISLNFNTRGADGLPGDGFIYRFFRGLRRWMIFVNPSIQGLNKAGMAFRNHPLRSSMMIAGLPTLLGYALPAIMRAVVGGGDGDDDDKNVVESYKDLPKWVRRTNIAIPIGGNNFVTIPLSYELRVSYGLGEMMWEYGEGMIDKDEVATETVSQLSDLLPISFSNGTVAQSISPSIARPLIDVIQNRNFYGKKIYNDSQFIEGYPEYMKAYAGTPKWLVKSTEVLNNVIPNLNAGVSDKYTPGAINVNPAIIDYLLSSYLGGLYNFPSKFGKTISMIWDEDMRDIQNVPIVSRNWKNSQSGNPYNSGDRYKTYMKEYDLSKQRFNGYKKEAEHDVPEFLKSLNDLLDTPSGKRMLMIDAYKRDGLDKLNRRIRDIDTYGNEKYEGEKDALTKRRDGLKEELINKLDSISDGTLDFVNGEWTRK